MRPAQGTGGQLVTNQAADCFNCKSLGAEQNREGSFPST
jgi:hypothetical protein